MLPTWSWAVVAALALERLAETRLAAAHARRLLARGGRLVDGDLWRPILTLHVAFFVACAVEGSFSPLAATGAWTWPLLAIFLAGQALRGWAIATLGDRWTTRLYVVPGEPTVSTGPYRWLRHPNYLGVALEVLALPLAFGLVATAVVFSLANGTLLLRRAKIEERALKEAAFA